MNALNFCLKEIAYDNGAVNRFTTEQEVLDAMFKGIVRSSTNEDGFTIAELNQVEDALSQMTEDELRDMSCDSPMRADDIIAKYRIPVELHMLIDEVLNYAFDCM